MHSNHRNSFSDWDRQVHKLFSSIATRYDVGNNLISFGFHKQWKRAMLIQSGKLQDRVRILDGATGTGDIAILAKQICPSAQVFGVDFTAEMLNEAKKRSISILGISSDDDQPGITFIESDLSHMDFFDDGYFDLYTIGFGLRNINDRNAVLKEMHRVLKADGVLSILELSKPVPPIIKPFTWFYLWCIMPLFSLLFTGSCKSYLWLAQSLIEYPAFTKLKVELEQAGFSDVECTYFGFRVVSLVTANVVKEI